MYVCMGGGVEMLRRGGEAENGHLENDKMESETGSFLNYTFPSLKKSDKPLLREIQCYTEPL